MTSPAPDVEPDLWDQALASARGLFVASLSLTEIPEPQTDRERLLVGLATQAGVLGTLAVTRQQTE